MRIALVVLSAAAVPATIFAQAGQVPRLRPLPADSLNAPWSGYGHDPQHTATSAQPAQALNSIHWQTPVDLNPPGGGQGAFSSTTGLPS